METCFHVFGNQISTTNLLVVFISKSQKVGQCYGLGKEMGYILASFGNRNLLYISFNQKKINMYTLLIQQQTNKNIN